LFEVGTWAFRLLFYALGTLLFGVMDAALVMGAGLERTPALGLSLLAVGFLYLPLRDRLWRLFRRAKKMPPHQLLRDALHVALAPSVEVRRDRWTALLQELFDPLEITNADEDVVSIRVEADGMDLLVPAVAGSSALRLAYVWRGASLVSPASRDLAEQLVATIKQAELSRDAYARGVIEERRRMAQDLHDDIGARLLSGLYLADDRTRPTFQAALADIRA